MAAGSVLLAILGVLVAVIYFYTKYSHNYWARKGVPHAKPNLLFGNLTDVIMMRKTIFEFFVETYKKFPNEPVVGIYGFTKPMVVIRDLDIIKDITIKDFNNFINRTFSLDEHGDPLGSELMFGKWDDDWRNVRHKTAPAFTSGRMKKMYPLIAKVGGDIHQLFKETAQKGKSVVDIRNYSSRYSVDVITSCAFGSQGGAIESPDTSVMFRVLSDIFNFKFKEGLASNLMFFARSAYVFVSRLGLGFKVFRHEVEQDIFKVVDIAAKQRIDAGDRRSDIFDTIVWTDSPELQSLNKKAGMAFGMLVGGSETSSTTIQLTLYELARHPDIQKKLQKEIRETLQKHNGEIPYDVLNNMEYLDLVFKEAVRMWPILPFLDRICKRDYTIAGTNITIEKGTKVFIPMWAIHKDPNYFPDPESFKPERFSREHGHSFPEMAYFPFGAGPRYCIGKRFGIISVKSFLVHLLKDFDVHLTEQTRKPLAWNKKAFTLSPDEMCLTIVPSKGEN